MGRGNVALQSMIDAPTAIREPNDVDIAEETAWSIIQQNKWIATPQLLFALKAWTKEIMEKRNASEKR